MVSYQTMISLAYQVAKSKEITFDGIDDTSQFTSELGEYWSNNKAELKQLTEDQTRRQLQQIVEP